MNHPLRVLCLALALLLAGCGSSPSREEVERLRQENEALRAQLGRAPAPSQTPAALAAHFADDPARGTLAGLVPGDSLAEARTRFGPQTRSRSWLSEGQRIYQYEWELEAGVVVRLNADETGRLDRVAVALAQPQGVTLPTLYGLTLGRETYLTVEQKFAAGLTTELHFWGAQGLYTVAQRVLLADSNQRLEFAYQMPTGLSRPELERLGEEVQRKHNTIVLLPYLRDRAPFLVALEEVR